MTLNFRGKLIDLSIPKILGILNLTPDSFYDGGSYNSIDKALKKCEKLIMEGADFIDLGAISTRPGANNLNEELEKKRLLPVLEKLIITFPEALFSIDTFRSEVANESLSIGAVMINDISGGEYDHQMFKTVSQFNCPYILMHRNRISKTKQKNLSNDNIVYDVINYLSKRINKASNAGINDIIIDPGFGYGKTLDDNFELLKNLNLFHSLNCPILIGISRKSMIWKTLNTSPKNSLNGTTFLHAVALQAGTKLLRVHDVKTAKECLDLLQALI
ncbi:MAG: dihydropteroate synthase [Flavobacteriaceae bacterium]|nr:dihydropteroate synthase [Flavobacteriaceae bacterium]|tara:strand:- start:6263 stop:7084 length:822 start_codon:yes stop_codon:yes gene_type:complete